MPDRLGVLPTLKRILLGTAAIVGLLIGTTLPASAHAAFVSSQPEPGSQLAAAPGTVRLRFTEPLIDELSSVTVMDPLGQTFRGGPPDERRMEVDVDSTALGSYTVEWKTVSPIDGHTLTGSYQFGVGADVGVQAAPSDRPGRADLGVAVARALEYLGLLGAVGLLSLSALADSAEAGWQPRGLHRWVALAAVGGLATVAGEVLLASSGSIVAAVRGFMTTSTGQVRLLRLGVELLALAVSAAAVRRAGKGRVEPRAARVGVAVLVLAALAAVAAAGHAAASSYGTWIATGHLWMAGVWAGTILAMAVHRPAGGWRDEVGRGLTHEFSPIALTGFTASVVLGLGRGLQELAGVSDLWATSYGQVLSAKTALVVVMASLSMLVWRQRRHHPRGEGLTAAAVVLLAAVLVAFPVPPGRAGDDPVAEAALDTEGLPQRGDLTLAKPVGDTVLGLSIRPAAPGINDLYVRLVPPGGEGADEIDMTLTVDGGRTSETRRCGAACRVATAPLEEGTTLTFDLAGLPAAEGQATFTMPALPPPDGSDLLADARTRMQQLESVRYDETLGPADPPVTSTWELVLPDRLHGVIGPPRYRETIRIEDRWWNRDDPEGDWTEARGSGSGLSVKVDQFLWDVNVTNPHLVGTDTVDGVATRVVAFYADLGQQPIWFRLWVDDDDRVRRAMMLAQGHFMDQRYHDFDAPITIEPPV